MRLRSKSSGQNRIPARRRALRLALAMMLAGGSQATLGAETTLSQLPQHSATVDRDDAALLPYPFEKHCSASSATRAPVERIVGLLGLTRQAHGPALLATQLPLAADIPHPQGDGSNAQCAAKATCGNEAATPEGAHTDGPTAACPTAVSPTAVSPTAGAKIVKKPAIGDGQFSPVVQAAALVSDSPQAEGSSRQSADKATSSPRNISDSPAEESELAGSLIDIDIPLTLSAPEATGQSAQRPAQEAADDTRSPQLVRSGTSMSLTIESQSSPTKGSSPSAPAVHRSAVDRGVSDGKAAGTSFSFSDAAPPVTASESVASGKPQTTGTTRDAILHRSSSSATHKTLATNKAPAAAGMQIKIEGEPAPLLNISDAASSPAPAMTPRPPLPTFAAGPLNRSSQVSSSPLSSSPLSSSPLSSSPLASSPVGLSPLKSPVASGSDSESSRQRHRVLPLQDQPTSQLLSTAEHSAQDSTRAMKVKERLNVDIQNATTIRTEQPLAELSAEHPHICQLLKTSEHTVSVIGMQSGATRIALVTHNDRGEREVELHEVSVGGNSPTSVSLGQIAKEISRTVAQLYPNSDVQITAYKDYLLVRGMATYEDDAKKILTLVRKTSLAPVVDQLQTH